MSERINLTVINICRRRESKEEIENEGKEINEGI